MHLHTGLGGVCGVLHGVVGAGTNEVCSMLEMWWMCGVFLMEWVSQWCLNHFHSLHQLVRVAGQKLHLMLLQIIKIVFPQIAGGVHDLKVSRKMWCRHVL